MIKIGMSFRSWLLGTTYYTPVNALAKIALSRTTLKNIDEQNRLYREERAGNG